ncbi:hypothetical protein GS429_18160 [Natronorubrum sp. JWXQ-INN-674]|uniref:Uncharacterized protein n=1 Tax=Natronorubrum halalkaliphilum TaxID=2691917 RepID=A0A6B0VQM1_9EURY|nr:hypothetical protein [Natronorubrum halalkaliphilum]MXV63950.1 hypothetical protein [Natronorubrum halalkaliphilum]
MDKIAETDDATYYKEEKDNSLFNGGGSAEHGLAEELFGACFLLFWAGGFTIIGVGGSLDHGIAGDVLAIGIGIVLLIVAGMGGSRLVGILVATAALLPGLIGSFTVMSSFTTGLLLSIASIAVVWGASSYSATVITDEDRSAFWLSIGCLAGVFLLIETAHAAPIGWGEFGRNGGIYYALCLLVLMLRTLENAKDDEDISYSK